MQHTERTTVAHHRSDLIYHVRRVSRADWQEEWGETDKKSEVKDKKSEVKQTRRVRWDRQEFQNQM